MNGGITMKKMIKVLVLAGALSMLLMACGKEKKVVEDTNAEIEEGTSEDTSLQYILDKGELILGLDTSFPPMGYKNPDQEIVGFDIDVATEVAKRMGVELVLTPISWKAKEQELATKNIDCIWNGFTKSPDRAEAMSLSLTYLMNTQVAVVLADSGIATLDDLAGKTVVIQNASTAADAMEQNKEFTDSLKQLVKVDNNVQALMDLKTAGSDSVVMDEVVARFYTETEPGVFTILDTALSEEEYVIGFRKDEIALTEEVNKHLREMKEDGALATISEKWFGEDITVVE